MLGVEGIVHCTQVGNDKDFSFHFYSAWVSTQLQRPFDRGVLVRESGPPSSRCSLLANSPSQILLLLMNNFAHWKWELLW